MPSRRRPGCTPARTRAATGIAEFRATGRLDGKPAIIAHGRKDGRVPAAFSSRPCVGLSSLADGDRSRLRHVEVANAEHFGTDLPGFDTRMIPLTLCHLRALDLMREYLAAGAALPESQVVRTTPRGGQPGRAPALQPGNVPPIAVHARPEDGISVRGERLELPD